MELLNELFEKFNLLLLPVVLQSVGAFHFFNFAVALHIEEVELSNQRLLIFADWAFLIVIIKIRQKSCSTQYFE